MTVGDWFIGVSVGSAVLIVGSGIAGRLADIHKALEVLVDLYRENGDWRKR